MHIYLSKKSSNYLFNCGEENTLTLTKSSESELFIDVEDDVDLVIFPVALLSYIHYIKE
jgi:hypothetical protein